MSIRKFVTSVLPVVLLASISNATVITVGPGAKYDYSTIQNAVNAEVTKTAANYTLEDGHGQRVATSIGFILYLRDLENYIKQHPEISFINTGRDGAFIKGTQWLETKDD